MSRWKQILKRAAGLLPGLLAAANLSAANRSLGIVHVPAVVREHRVASLGPLAGTNELRLSLGLPLHHAAELKQLLTDLYNPASPSYHHYLKTGEFAARFGPTPEEYRQVIEFARTNGLRVTGTHANRLVVRVAGRAEAVSRAFQVRLNEYRHPVENRTFYAPASAPVVDANLPLVEVRGLDNYQLPRPRSHPLSAPRAGAAPRGGSGLNGWYLGADFRAAYVPGTTLTGTGQSVGLFELDGYYAADITNYEALTGITNIPLTNVLLDGSGGSAGGNDFEVSLDIEMAMAMAPGLASIIVYEGVDPLDVLTRMADDDSAAQLSSSWGWGGGPGPTLDAVFQQMAAQGQSFFEASGDNDAYLPGDVDNASEANAPTDNPWLTCVGGTELTTSGPGGGRADETVWNWSGANGSGGGQSVYYALPAWQAGLDMNANGGSTVYRNFPDVAMAADNIVVTYGNGSTWGGAGTSFAAPLWAGFMALVNQQAAAQGSPAAGFLNPALYALGRGTAAPSVFYDITQGNNTNSASPGEYPATDGYDLCSGWGTPSGTNLINALAMPDWLGIPGGTNLSAAGPVGGPFSATNWAVMLTNTGPGPLAWSLGALPGWLAASPTAGTLATNDTVTVALSLTPAAHYLPPGNYPVPVEVTNAPQTRVDVAAVLTLAVDPSVVVNGGFETGDFTGWTLAGDTTIGATTENGVNNQAVFPGVVHSGYYGALLGETGYPAILSQPLATAPSAWYLISFWLDNPSGGTNQIFNFGWGGTNLVTLTNPPAFGWTNFVLVAAAAATNTLLAFAAENDPNYFGLDDVAVTAVPPVAFRGCQWQTNGLQLSWDSLAELNYAVQASTNLSSPVWIQLGALTAATNVTRWTDTNAGPASPAQFYRLVFLP